MKKDAFTLIEILVVIAIIMLTMSFGLISFFRFQDRQKVENTAKEVITYLRRIQGYAKNGNRGQGSCNVEARLIAAGDKPLENWTTTFTENELRSRPYCGVYGNFDYFRLPTNLKFVPTAGNIVFHSLFGNTVSNVTNNRIIVHDGTNYYKFHIYRGAITNGCWCEGANCNLPAGEC